MAFNALMLNIYDIIQTTPNLIKLRMVTHYWMQWSHFMIYFTLS